MEYSILVLKIWIHTYLYNGKYYIRFKQGPVLADPLIKTI